MCKCETCHVLLCAPHSRRFHYKEHVETNVHVHSTHNYNDSVRGTGVTTYRREDVVCQVRLLRVCVFPLSLLLFCNVFCMQFDLLSICRAGLSHAA